jgi:hypothetical protein
MPIVVTTYPNPLANGYVTLLEARAYWAERLMTHTSTGVDDTVSSAIIRATQYLDVRFGFVGYRELKDQDREWPRAYAYDNRGDRIIGVPKAIKDATCEYAFRALSASLLADPVRDDSGRVVKSKDEKVGPIAESVEYSEYAGFELPAYPAADRLLLAKGLIMGKAGGISTGYIGRA